MSIPVINRAYLNISDEELDDLMSRPQAVKVAEPQEYKSVLTEESLDEWFRTKVWGASNTGSRNKALYIMREGRLVPIGWWVLNKMWKYRRGKSGRVIRRPSKHCDDCMRIVERFTRAEGINNGKQD